MAFLLLHREAEVDVENQLVKAELTQTLHILPRVCSGVFVVQRTEVQVVASAGVICVAGFLEKLYRRLCECEANRAIYVLKLSRRQN